MEITEVKVFPVRDKKLRAFVSIVFDASFMVNDIKVIQGKDGLFISMPSRRKKNGRFKDIAHPLNQETRQLLEDRIISEYQRRREGDEKAQPEAAAEAEGSSRGATEVEEPSAAAGAEARPEAASSAAGDDPAGESDGEGEEERPAADEKSLEEVAEAHLSDSYWTT